MTIKMMGTTLIKNLKIKKKALEYIKDRKNKIWKKYVANQGKYD